MTLFSSLFKGRTDKKDIPASQSKAKPDAGSAIPAAPVQQKPAAPPTPIPFEKKSIPAPPPAMKLEEILSAFQQIEELVTSSKDELAPDEAPAERSIVYLPLRDMAKIIPAAFDTSVQPPPPSARAEIAVDDLFGQLGRGKVETTLRNFLLDVPKQYLLDSFNVNSEEKVTLPLPMIVNAINPNEMKKRTATVLREVGLRDLPNVFSSAREKESADGETAQGIEMPELAAQTDSAPRPAVKPAPAAPAAAVAPPAPVAPPSAPAPVVSPKPEPVAPAASAATKPPPAQPLKLRTETGPLPGKVEADKPVQAAPQPTQPAQVEPKPTTPKAPAEAPKPRPAAPEATVPQHASAPIPPVSRPSAATPTQQGMPAKAIPLVTPEPETPPPAPPPIAPKIAASISSAPVAPAARPVSDKPTAPRIEKPPVSKPPLAPIQPPPAPKEEKPAPPAAMPAPDREPAPATELSGAPVLMHRGIDLNTASADEMCRRLNGVGRQLANRIVEDRISNGPFFDLFDLARVTGISRKTFEKVTGRRWREELHSQIAIVNRVLGKWKTSPQMKDIALRFKALPGFEGCAIIHVDGDMLANSLQDSRDEALQAMAPQIIKRVTTYMRHISGSETFSVAVFMEGRFVSFVQSEDICFVAVHNQKGFSQRHMQIVQGVGKMLGRRLHGIRET